MGLSAQPDTCKGCSRTFLTGTDNLRQQQEQSPYPRSPLQHPVWFLSFYHLIPPTCQGGNGNPREVQGVSPSHGALE